MCPSPTLISATKGPRRLGRGQHTIPIVMPYPGGLLQTRSDCCAPAMGIETFPVHAASRAAANSFPVRVAPSSPRGVAPGEELGRSTRRTAVPSESGLRRRGHGPAPHSRSRPRSGASLWAGCGGIDQEVSGQVGYAKVRHVSASCGVVEVRGLTASRSRLRPIFPRGHGVRCENSIRRRVAARSAR